MSPGWEPRLGDADPLDSRLAAAHGHVAAAGPWWALRSRPALGMAPMPRPGLVLLTIGAALGPLGLGMLSPVVLAALDPIVSVALAALGVLVGLGLNLQRSGDGRLLAAASLQAALTMVVVAAGVAAVESLWLRGGVGTWLAAALLGICAAASSTAARADDDETVAMRISDLDDLVPIVAGGVALTLLHSSAWQAPGLTLIGAGISIAVAVAGWLLVGRSTASSEQRTYLAGTLLLVGGSAAYLGQSALLGGLIAGLVWSVAGGEVRERIARDLRALQHPLIVLLLLVAGARFIYAPTLLIVAIVYVASRVAGKLGGGWVAGRLVGRGVTPGLGLALVSPGVAGIACAVNVVQVDADADRAAVVLTVVVAGSLASELLSLVVRPQERR